MQQTSSTDTFSKNTLIILRGISGSGKSTLARSLSQNEPDAVHFSSDDFFIDHSTGNYVFSPQRLGRAHEWNQQRAERAMKTGSKLIIVDNTHTQKWEAKPYVEYAQKYEYEVIFREPETSWKFNASVLAQKNVHGVPQDKIQQMIDRWENDFTVENVLNAKDPAHVRKQKRTPARLPSMIQVVLDKSSKDLLMSKVKKMNRGLYAEHVTIGFKSDEETYRKLITDRGLLEGDRVKVKTDLLVWNEDFGVEALRVASMQTHDGTPVESANKVPHITISVSTESGRRPHESNDLLEMLEQNVEQVRSEELALELNGIIKFFFFGSQRRRDDKNGGNQRGGRGRGRGRRGSK